MRIDFNGITREMTPAEIEVLEEENRLLKNDNSESDISERLKRLENKTSNTLTEMATLKEAFLTLKETMSNLRNLTKL